MNNQNIIYALLGASAVALAWIASIALSAVGVNFAIAGYIIAAVIAVIAQDYRNSVKALK